MLQWTRDTCFTLCPGFLHIHSFSKIFKNTPWKKRGRWWHWPHNREETRGWRPDGMQRCLATKRKNSTRKGQADRRSPRHCWGSPRTRVLQRGGGQLGQMGQRGKKMQWLNCAARSGIGEAIRDLRRGQSGAKARAAMTKKCRGAGNRAPHHFSGHQRERLGSGLTLPVQTLVLLLISCVNLNKLLNSLSSYFFT